MISKENQSIKFLSLLILLFLVSGCAQFSPKESTTTTSSTTTTTTQLPTNQYDLQIDDTITVENLLIVVTNIKTDGTVILNIEGKEVPVLKTREPVISNGLQITSLQISYGSDPSQFKALMEIKPFLLENDQYMLVQHVTTTVHGTDITLDNLHVSNQATFTVEGKQYALAPGETMNVGPLKIINEKQHYEDISSDRYVIIRVVS